LNISFVWTFQHLGLVCDSDVVCYVASCTHVFKHYFAIAVKITWSNQWNCIHNPEPLAMN